MNCMMYFLIHLIKNNVATTECSTTHLLELSYLVAIVVVGFLLLFIVYFHVCLLVDFSAAIKFSINFTILIYAWKCIVVAL